MTRKDVTTLCYSTLALPPPGSSGRSTQAQVRKLARRQIDCNRCQRFYVPDHTGCFYSADQHEPPHVYVERDDSEAKFWLDPVRLESSRGFRHSDLRQIEDLIIDNKDFLLGAWHEHFGS